MTLDLDDLQAIERADTLGVLRTVEGFAEQCREGWTIGRAARGLPSADQISSVVVLGMGGSGVGGDVARAVLEPRLWVPWQTLRSYGPLPEWIGRNTLAFALSYSGATEETIESASLAHERGARLVTISSGGRLAGSSEEWGTAHISIPGGLQPRAALGYLLMPLFATLVEMGAIPEMQDDVDEAVGVLADLGARCDRRRSVQENPAKDLARRLRGRIPVVYGGAGLGAAAAYRFKCDLNEYGKTPAFWNQLPELNHNEIEGWIGLRDLKDSVSVVMLRDPDDHERVALRFDLTRELVEAHVAEVIEVKAEGNGPLARILSLIMLTQLASIYVGLSYGVDPGPVNVLQDLKDRLADS